MHQFLFSFFFTVSKPLIVNHPVSGNIYLCVSCYLQQLKPCNMYINNPFWQFLVSHFKLYSVQFSFQNFQWIYSHNIDLNWLRLTKEIDCQQCWLFPIDYIRLILYSFQKYHIQSVYSYNIDMNPFKLETEIDSWPFPVIEFRFIVHSFRKSSIYTKNLSIKYGY